ncbi:MAG TPA: Arc family DNA-binding protein [Burkholderiaceae bacterium]
MTVNLSVKNVPERVAEQLRKRAEHHHRSLQGELLAILEQAGAEAEAAAVSLEAAGSGVPTDGSGAAGATAAPGSGAVPATGPSRSRLTIADLADSARSSGLRGPSESASILRKLRDERNSR